MAALYPGRLPDALEVRVADWTSGTARMTFTPGRGFLIEVSGRETNPRFSGLVAHELGHVWWCMKGREFWTAWERAEWAHGFAPRQYPARGWWEYSTIESFAENWTRALYWPTYSPWAHPRTSMVWMSRVQFNEFIRGW